MQLHVSIVGRPKNLIINNSSLTLNSKVGKLRRIIAALSSLDLNLIRMFYGGKQLEDDGTLLSYRLKENCTLIVTLKVPTEVKEDFSKKILERAPFQPKNKILARCQKYWCWIPAVVKEVRIDESVKGSTVQYLYTIEFDDPVPKKVKKVVEVYGTDIRATLFSVKGELKARTLVMVSYPLNDIYPSPQRYDAVVVKSPTKTADGEKIELDLIIGENNRTRVVVNGRKDMRMVPRVVLQDDDYDSDDEAVRTDEAEQLTCDFCVGRRNVKTCTSCGCNVCGQKDQQPRVYCDECLYPFHNHCADVPVGHVGDWYCTGCSNEVKENEKKTPKPKTKRETRKRSKDEIAVNCENDEPSTSTDVVPPSAKKTKNWGGGMATASRNKVCKKVPITHVGKIPGVLVGSSWRYRITCSESGVHRAPVAGIHGTLKTAFSIVISGGYDDDVDHGDWFIYSGSGGRVLANNARTAEQSHDQVLTKSNLGLAMTCAAPFSNNGGEAKDFRESQPIRVVRNSKALKIGKYAPPIGNRYDGIYKLKKYWPSTGKSGHKVYLFEFHRDDNEPAPWTKEGMEVIKRNNLVMEWPAGIAKNPKEAGIAAEDSVPRKPVAYKIGKEIKAAIAKDVLNKRNWDEVLASAKFGHKRYYDQVELTFLCGVCMNMIIEPITLKCGHNLCVGCWNKMTKKEDSVIACPVCRNPAEEDTPVNLDLKRALELVWAADI